ncbi:ribosomal protein S16-domain-containing protein [Cladochytrium replicatum]|nr:ribosomal protein S16-domain-containing protein [Cladochytrium replicatum]
MGIRIRLSRWGASHNPFYGIVIANKRSPRDRKFLERVGTYNPVPVWPANNPFELTIDEMRERVASDGAPAQRDGKTHAPLASLEFGKAGKAVKNVELNLDRIKYWLSVGAQPTQRAGVMPPTPEQLHREGKISLVDQSTWEVELEAKNSGSSTEPPQKIKLSADQAKQVFSGYTGKNPHILTLPHVRKLSESGEVKLPPPPRLDWQKLTLDGRRPPKEPLNPQELLYVLQEFTGIR